MRCQYLPFGNTVEPQRPVSNLVARMSSTEDETAVKFIFIHSYYIICNKVLSKQAKIMI